MYLEYSTKSETAGPLSLEIKKKKRRRKGRRRRGRRRGSSSHQTIKL